VKDRELARALGDAIKARRLELGLSQERLAERSGFKRAYTAAIERGEKAITVENADKIAKALELSLAEFFKRVEEATRGPINA